MKRPVAIAAAVVVASCPQPAAATEWFIPPVDGPIVARFEAPGHRWGPGHRGIDYSVAATTSVRAAGDGIVTFAGPVAGTIAITIDHGGGVETTYTDLGDVLVEPGDHVTQGHWIARSGSAHGGGPGLHLGVIVDGTYVDPEDFIGPVDISDAIHLAPHVWMPPDTLPATFRTPLLSATAVEPCAPARPVAATPSAPNENIAVLIAGIGSKTRGGTSAALHEAGPGLLGFPEEATYRFSYRSSDEADLHVAYDRTDTFGDLRAAAARLRVLLMRIGHRHPDRAVDLIAHSQGGIVARAYLQLVAHAWDQRLPRVEHLVTLATPHGGAPLGTAPASLGRTSGGKVALALASRWARGGGPMPDPYAPAVAQLAPGSELLTALGQESVLYGTRVLSLGIGNDVVVPADRTNWDGYASAIVGPEGLNGHDSIVSSVTARGIAHSFLRDARETCRAAWDLWGPRVGAGISFAERALPWLLARAAAAFP